MSIRGTYAIEDNYTIHSSRNNKLMVTPLLDAAKHAIFLTSMHSFHIKTHLKQANTADFASYISINLVFHSVIYLPSYIDLSNFRNFTDQ